MNSKLFSALLTGAYFAFALGMQQLVPSFVAPDVPGAVVLPAPLQTAMYLGDRYLAANIESSRVLVTGGVAVGTRVDYFERLHRTVAELNPCHEDNYYVASALLAWGGGVDSALSILEDATQCRFWDEMPPFFWGFDLNFFKQEHQKAKVALFEAAKRSKDNRIAFQRIGLMFESEAYPDPHMARAFLKSQRDQVRDSKLKQSLDARIGRLDGLVILLDAQREYEHQFGKPLQNPEGLLVKGILRAFPIDPVGLGYVFENGHFALREVKFRGEEGMRK